MTLPIVLAIAGCAALLVGLFGGGVKAKEIEVPRISILSRIFSGVIGLVLIGIAIWISYVNPSQLSGLTPEPTISEIPTATQIQPQQTILANEIPFTYASDFGSGITIQRVWAQNTGTNVEFHFDYTSDVDRGMSFFNPPDGDIISIQKDLPAGTNSVLIVASVDALQKVSNITVNFYIPGGELTGAIFLDFQEIKNILP